MRTERFDLNDSEQSAKFLALFLSIINPGTQKAEKEYKAIVKIEQTNNIVDIEFECGYEEAEYYECKFEENGTLQ